MYILLQSRNKVVVTIIIHERAAKSLTCAGGLADMVCSFRQEKI
jgi:hypothetical protein